MKLAIFVDQFPVRSQTFVLNQVTGLIDLGVDVTIISLNASDKVIFNDENLKQYNLAKRTIYLLNSNSTKQHKLLKFTSRSFTVIKGLLINQNRSAIVKSLNAPLYGQQAKSLLLASIVAKFSKSLNFDVILAHFGFNGVTANQLRELGVLEGKIATIFHGYEVSSEQALLQHQKNYQALFKQTELMLPISELWQRKLIELGCAKNKITVHRMGVDLTHFQYSLEPKSIELSSLEPQNLNVFTVARFTEKKGLKYAIKAMAILKQEAKVKFHYTLAGFGELAGELQQLVVDLNLSDQISFVGEVNSAQVKLYMKSADVFLQPSITAKNGDMEGVPVAIMEAMAMGTVVVSTFHSGIPELITHKNHGFLAQECDENELAQYLTLVALDEKLSKAIAVNARKRIEEVGNIDQLNKDLVKLFQN